MNKQYTSNLCTFMGRENNVKILIQYIERALEINAIDRYYMIDMTRCISDHEYIYKQQQRLDSLYPNRVFVVNRDLRGRQLRDGTWKDTLGFWEPFYKFCKTFTDNDIIIKCDDDTLYFDVETLRAACDLRWSNKDPLLMHANTINNGICAFHQSKTGVWDSLDPIVKEYPTSGLTGPLFSHPGVACDCHEQFTRDLESGSNNINKYKLKNNIYFTARVSINFIFMLGSDRKALSKINAQDEYVASSKLGQQLDRPNMIIGDFIAAHHTYGVQEPEMEKRKTFKLYESLAAVTLRGSHKNKEITSSYNPTSTIKSSGRHMMKYWSGENSYTIKNTTTGKYINLNWNKTERIKVTDKNTREGLGVFWHKTELGATHDMEDSTLFTLDVNAPTLIQIQNCTEILKASDPNINNPRYLSFPIKIWFQQNYRKQLTNFHPQPDGSYKIESIANPGFFLVAGDSKDKILYFFQKDGEDTWELDSYKNESKNIVSGNIHRGNQHEVENDPTTATVPGLPANKNFREFYWMVTGYIWEFIETDDGVYHIRLVADDEEPWYLSVTRDDVHVRRKPCQFEVKNNNIKHIASNSYIHIKKDGVELSKSRVNLKVDIK